MVPRDNIADQRSPCKFLIFSSLPLIILRQIPVLNIKVKKEPLIKRAAHVCIKRKGSINATLLQSHNLNVKPIATQKVYKCFLNLEHELDNGLHICFGHFEFFKAKKLLLHF